MDSVKCSTRRSVSPVNRPPQVFWLMMISNRTAARPENALAFLSCYDGREEVATSPDAGLARAGLQRTKLRVQRPGREMRTAALLAEARRSRSGRRRSRH